MSRIIKSVALDDKTAKIAESLPNFSHFVRECLFRHAVHTTLECTREKSWHGTDRCSPLTQPVCFVCWPNGSPGSPAIKAESETRRGRWGEGRVEGTPDLVFLDAEARKVNSELINLKGINYQQPKKKAKSPETLGFFASIRQKIRNRSP